MVDKEVIQQVLGSLMKCPRLLSEVDKYNLTLSDFSSKFEKYIFSAIHGLYFNGAESIQIIDIENYLSTNPIAKNTFESNNGIEYLQDIEEFSKVENFQYYYDKLKKINLLNDLKKDGFDISDYYSDDLTSDKAIEINERFEELNTKDIKIGPDFVKVKSQWDNLIKKGKTPKGIYFCTKYFYDIKKGDPKKSEHGIGIISYIYEEGAAYWIEKEQKDKGICARIEEQIRQSQNREKKIVKKTKEKKVKTYDLSDI